MKAYLLARVKPGFDKDVIEKIKGLNPVKEVASIYGEYDLIAKVEIENLEKLDEFVFNTIRKIDGVERTTTLIVTQLFLK